jgi:polysaccharide pyruvyl transferase WcaK-like protein
MIVNRTNFIVVRDAESKAFLKTAGIIRPPIYVAADPTLTLPTSDFETIKEVLRQECLDGQAPMVAIAPRRWFHYVHSIIPVKYIAKYKLWKLKGTERFEALKGILAKISDYLIESYKVKIVFVPMRMANGDIHPGQDDDRVCGEIMDIMKHRENVTMLAGDYSPCELKGFLGQMEMVIGMRMHALILASSMHVPVIGISYGPKGRSYFKMIGLPEYEMDVEKVTLNWLKGTVDELWNNKDKVREHLKTVMGPLRKKAEHSTVYVTKFLK